MLSVLLIVSPLTDFGRKVEDVYGNKMNVSVSTGLLPRHGVCRGKLPPQYFSLKCLGDVQRLPLKTSFYLGGAP